MGDLLRFPGATVDYDFLDAWEWTPELLAEYAARARQLAARYGSNQPTATLGRWPSGRCQDCDRSGRRRYRVGRRLLCESCAEPRLRVHRDRPRPLEQQSSAPAAPGLDAGKAAAAEGRSNEP